MNSAKPPPPPQRPATSRPPPPPLLRSTPPAHAPSRVPAPAAVTPVAAAPVPGQETRLRVSVKLSVRDPSLLIARPLAEGQAPPPGTREAMLVIVEPAAHEAHEAHEANTSNGGQTP